MKTITRRHFVVGAAALGSALALGGCGAKPTGSEAPSSEQGESADIVVIGAGLAEYPPREPLRSKGPA